MAGSWWYAIDIDGEAVFHAACWRPAPGRSIAPAILP